MRQRHRGRIDVEDVIGSKLLAVLVVGVVRHHQAIVKAEAQPRRHPTVPVFDQAHLAQVVEAERRHRLPGVRRVDRAVEREQLDQRVERRRRVEAPQVVRQILTEVALADRQRGAHGVADRGAGETMAIEDRPDSTQGGGVRDGERSVEHGGRNRGHEASWGEAARREYWRMETVSIPRNRQEDYSI